IEHEQAVVERLENVLVERTHPIELERLDVQLAIEAGVFKRRRNLAGDGGEQAHVLAVERLARILASDREYGDGALLCNAGHEVAEARIAPILDLFDGKPRRRNRIVECHGMAGG